MANRADRFTTTDKKTQIYSDFLTDLNKHPVSGDVVRFVNEQAVIRSIKNLLNTNRKERLYQPKIGSSIRSMLFEPMGSATANEIATFARETINTHEPRAKVLEITVIPKYEQNLYIVNVTILVINRQEPTNFNVTLTRVR